MARLRLDLLLAALAGLSGFWLGEAGRGVAGFFEGALGCLAVFVVTVLWRGSWLSRLGYGLGVGLGVAGVWWLSFLAGQQSVQAAFNRCLDEGAQVRAALAAYRLKHPGYPPALAALGGPLPCKPYLHASLLHYQRTPSGYELWFGDVFVTHRATELQEFESRK